MYCSRRGFPDLPEKYRRVRRPAAKVVEDTKALAWEEFGGTMEKDFQVAPKIWKTG